MNPKVKTAIAVAAPILLALLQIVLKEKLPMWLGVFAIVCMAVIAVLNAFHVSAGVVATIQGLLGVITTYQTEPSANVTPPPALMMRAKKIVSSLDSATVIVATMLLCFVAPSMVLSACNTPEGKTAQNLWTPGLACAEEAILDLAGASDPNIISGACVKFGAVVVGDVVTIASQLLAQQGPVPTGAAVSPLRVRLEKISAWKPQ